MNDTKSENRTAWMWLRGASIIIFSVDAAWFAYIYGMMGHVCPFAFIALWGGAFLASVMVSRRVPHWGALVISFFVVAGMFAWAWVVHDARPYIHVTPEPALIFVGAGVLAFAVNWSVSRYKIAKRPKEWRVKAANLIGSAGALMGIILGTGYLVIPAVKEEWTKIGPDGLEWFDTFWQGFDVYYIILFLALFWLVCSAAWIAGQVVQSRYPNNQAGKGLLLLGIGFITLGFIGILPLYRYLSIWVEELEPGTRAG